MNFSIYKKEFNKTGFRALRRGWLRVVINIPNHTGICCGLGFSKIALYSTHEYHDGWDYTPKVKKAWWSVEWHKPKTLIKDSDKQGPKL